MDKFKKYLLTGLVAVGCVLMATTSVTAWTQDCDTIEEQIQAVQNEINSLTGACELWMTYGHASYMQECLSLQSQYREMQEWADENCGEE